MALTGTKIRELYVRVQKGDAVGKASDEDRLKVQGEKSWRFSYCHAGKQKACTLNIDSDTPQSAIAGSTSNGCSFLSKNGCPCPDNYPETGGYPVSTIICVIPLAPDRAVCLLRELSHLPLSEPLTGKTVNGIVLSIHIYEYTTI